jgi:hypothetical protein
MSPARARTGEKARPTSRAFAVWIISRERAVNGPIGTIVAKSTAPEKAEISAIGTGVEEQRPPHRCDATRSPPRCGVATAK